MYAPTVIDYDKEALKDILDVNVARDAIFLFDRAIFYGVRTFVISRDDAARRFSAKEMAKIPSVIKRKNPMTGKNEVVQTVDEVICLVSNISATRRVAWQKQQILDALAEFFGEFRTLNTDVMGKRGCETARCRYAYPLGGDLQPPAGSRVWTWCVKGGDAAYCSGIYSNCARQSIFRAAGPRHAEILVERQQAGQPIYVSDMVRNQAVALRNSLSRLGTAGYLPVGSGDNGFLAGTMDLQQQNNGGFLTSFKKMFGG